MRSFALPIMACLTLPAHNAVAAEAHVHGRAHLAVAVDGDSLTLLLESPAESLAGFEHTPRSDRERAAIAAMKKALEQGEQAFLPNPEAGCRAQTATLSSPLFGQAGEAGHGHADVDGEFIFRCAHPEALREVEVRLFDAFPRLKCLDVEIATPRGQKAMVLDAGQRRISW